jgi:hypothetical protein
MLRTKSALCWKRRPANIRHRIVMWSERRSYCSPRKVSPTMSSLLAWTLRGRLSASGASDSPSRGFLAWSRNLGAGVPPSFPPSVVVQVKVLACELPHRLQLPLSRLSLSEIRREVITQGWVTEISGATLWRYLFSSPSLFGEVPYLRSGLCGSNFRAERVEMFGILLDYAGCWYRPITFPPGSRNLAVISGASAPDRLHDLSTIRDDSIQRRRHAIDHDIKQ